MRKPEAWWKAKIADQHHHLHQTNNHLKDMEELGLPVKLDRRRRSTGPK